MKDLILLSTLSAVVAFGYFIMAKVDRFIEENHRLLHEQNRQNRTQIHVAAESPTILDSIAGQLRVYSAANPMVEIFLRTGKREKILQKLQEGTLDIALLAESENALFDTSCAKIRIPCRMGEVISSSLGLSVAPLEEEQWVFVIWNKSVHSKERDRILFAIETEYCSLKCGYADYLM